MPTAAIITICDAVITALNAATLSQAFVAERGYFPTFELKDMDQLAVTVVPRGDDGQVDSRSTSQHDYVLDISIQKKPPTFTNATLDPLTLLTEEIAEYFRFVERQGGAKCVGQVAVRYEQKHFQTFAQFTAVITLTFRGWRE